MRSMPSVMLLQPGDHPQGGGLAAARRPEQHHELTVVDRQVEVIDGDDVVEPLGDALEGDAGHGTSRSCWSRRTVAKRDVREADEEVATTVSPMPGGTKAVRVGRHVRARKVDLVVKVAFAVLLLYILVLVENGPRTQDERFIQLVALLGGAWS